MLGQSIHGKTCMLRLHTVHKKLLISSHLTDSTGAKVVAKAFPGQPGSMFVLRNSQPELMESSMLTFRETLKISSGGILLYRIYVEMQSFAKIFFIAVEFRW